MALLFYVYATGVFSSRKNEKATSEALPFRFVAGGLHPDHDTLANFRKTFRGEITELFVQVLLLAQAAGYNPTLPPAASRITRAGKSASPRESDFCRGR